MSTYIIASIYTAFRNVLLCLWYAINWLYIRELQGIMMPSKCFRLCL